MSSISETRRPSRKGDRYSSTATQTGVGRCVNVAQPTPVRPGTEVSTLTTTSRVPYGAVLMERMAVIWGAGGQSAGAAGPEQYQRAVAQARGLAQRRPVRGASRVAHSRVGGVALSVRHPLQ